MHWSELFWQVHWQSRLNTVIKCDMPPSRTALRCYYWKCCSQMKASWLWGGYFGVLPKPQASTGLNVTCGPQWEIYCSMRMVYLHNDDKSPLSSTESSLCGILGYDCAIDVNKTILNCVCIDRTNVLRKKYQIKNLKNFDKKKNYITKSLLFKRMQFNELKYRWTFTAVETYN